MAGESHDTLVTQFNKPNIVLHLVYFNTTFHLPLPYCCTYILTHLRKPFKQQSDMVFEGFKSS